MTRHTSAVMSAPCAQTHGRFLRGVAIVALEPIRPALAQTVMQIRFAHVIEDAVDFPFLVELNSGSDIDVLVFRLIVRVLGI